MIIGLEKVSKSYEKPGSLKKREVLNEISLKVDSGESLSVIGPSGSGKSTLLNILGTLDMPTSGMVKLNDKNILNYSESQLAEIRNQHIGFIFQMHHLLPQLTLLENVLLPTIASNSNNDKAGLERAKELLESVNLHDKIKQYPSQLSGGECQRATVVRALINQPGLILADEPTGSLDEDSAEQLGELLSKINKEQNVAMIVVTHSMELAKKMNKMYKLNHGKLVGMNNN